MCGVAFTADMADMANAPPMIPSLPNYHRLELSRMSHSGRLRRNGLDTMLVA